MTDVTVVSLSKDTLGESPLWLSERDELVWLDLIEGVLHRLILGNGELISISVQARQPLGAVVRTSHPDTLLLGCRDGIGTLDIASGTWTAFLDIEPGRVGMCLNDMKVDRHARLWVGSYEETETDSVGALWCKPTLYAPAVLCDCGFIVPNGPAFSPNGQVLYFSDSLARRIVAYDLDQKDPRVLNKRVFAMLNDNEGIPDGLTVDQEGCIWVAHWDGGCISRWHPDGSRLSTITLPVSHPTNVAFGGTRLETLYITSARFGLDDQVLAQTPYAGSLFTITPGTHGLPEGTIQLDFHNHS